MSRLQQLGILDGAFLHLESAEMPMHVGSLALYEPPEDKHQPWVDAVRSHIASRMHLVPVFTRKLAGLPLALANPVWVDDPEVDLEYHIQTHRLPAPGTIEQIEALAARLHSLPLDRLRPLWEFHVIEGLSDHRVGLYSKLHHAAVDGQAAVAMAQSLFDPTPQPRHVEPPRARRPADPPRLAELVGAGLSNQWLQLRRFAKLLPPLAAAALASVREGAASPSGPPSGQGAVSWLKLAPVTPFNRRIDARRVFAAVALPLPPLKSIGKVHGASINDMVIWLCSTALRSYLRQVRKLPEHTLVAGVPVSLRSEGDSSSNNQVSMTLIDLATEVDDPLQRLAAITASTRTMKVGVSRFGNLIPKDFPSLGAPWLIGGLASLYGRTRLADHLRVINLVISNVPGPQVPMYLAGARLTGIFPLSIVVHGVGLNITVQSYLGQLCFGLIACRRAVPDMDMLAGHLRQAMDAAAALSAPTSVAAADAAPAPVRKRPPRNATGQTADPKKPAAARIQRRTGAPAPKAPRPAAGRAATRR